MNKTSPEKDQANTMNMPGKIVPRQRTVNMPGNIVQTKNSEHA